MLFHNASAFDVTISLPVIVHCLSDAERQCPAVVCLQTASATSLPRCSLIRSITRSKDANSPAQVASWPSRTNSRSVTSRRAKVSASAARLSQWIVHALSSSTPHCASSHVAVPSAPRGRPKRLQRRRILLKELDTCFSTRSPAQTMTILGPLHACMVCAIVAKSPATASLKPLAHSTGFPSGLTIVHSKNRRSATEFARRRGPRRKTG